MAEPLPYESVPMVLLRRAQHVLFAGLLVLGTVRAVAGPHPAAVLGVAAAVAAWYATGALLAHGPTAIADRRLWPWLGAAWLVVLIAGWVALIALSAEYVWLAFALFLLALGMLPVGLDLVAVALLTASAVIASAAHRGGVDEAAVLGPAIGAAVAVVMTYVYRGLREEARSRAQLVHQLTAAQDRLAAAERQAGMMAERERLAREIHDTVAQSLSSIILLLRAVAAQAPSGTNERIDVATRTAQHALEDTRRLVRALTPAQLAGQPLAQALGRLCEQTRAWQLDVQFMVEGDDYPLPTPVEVTLLRVAQEALANVRAHAGATTARVTLTYLPDSVNLDVVDNGRGFDPDRPGAAPTAGTGLGLAAMRSRLAEVGGLLTIEAAPGQGTVLNAAIPVVEP
ncbi:MAG TPA: sensor histidine kinase [Micromonosporaceae bacterium]